MCRCCSSFFFFLPISFLISFDFFFAVHILFNFGLISGGFVSRATAFDSAFAFTFPPFALTFPSDHDAQTGFGGVAAPAVAHLSSLAVAVSWYSLSCFSCYSSGSFSTCSCSCWRHGLLAGIRPDYVAKLVRDTLVYPLPNHKPLPTTNITTFNTIASRCHQHRLQEQPQQEPQEPQQQESQQSQEHQEQQLFSKHSSNGLPAGSRDSCHTQSYIT